MVATSLKEINRNNGNVQFETSKAHCCRYKGLYYSVGNDIEYNLNSPHKA